MTEALCALGATLFMSLVLIIFTYGKLTQKVESIRSDLQNHLKHDVAAIKHDMSQAQQDIAWIKGQLEKDGK